MKSSQLPHSIHLENSEANTRALKISGLLTGVYFVIELGIGLWTGSVSVTSDAFHTFSAVGGVLIALVAGHYAKRQATEFQSFGLIRAEIVGALFNGLFLLGMAVFVFVMGLMRLSNPVELSTLPMLLAALGGLVTELISIKLLYKKQKGNLNMKGAFWHVMQTLIGSIIIIVAAVVIRFTGFLAIDPLLGMAFGLVLFWASWKIIREALHILLDNVPRDLDLKLVEKRINGIQGVERTHHLLMLKYPARAILVTYRRGFMKFGVYFSTIQVETECLEEAQAKEIDYIKP